MNRSVARGTALIAIAIIAIAALVLLPNPSSKQRPNDDPWQLVSYDPDTKYGTYLGNGFISTRIKGDGVGYQDGQPLPCFMAGLYDDEKLISTPTWSDLRFYNGKQQFKIDKKADYRQVLNMKTGILTTYATWRAGEKTLKGKIEVIVSRARPNLALIYAQLSPDFDGEVRAVAPVGAATPGLSGYDTERGNGDGSVLAFNEYRTAHSGITFLLGKRLTGTPHSERKYARLDALEVRLAAKPDNQITVSSYAVLVDAKDSKQAWDTSHKEIWFGNEHDALIDAQKAAWAKLWKRDITIDGPRKDQQAIHTCMFYLLQSVREGSHWSIPPMGLSDNAFSGHVFWDADLWMFPALILQHPELARSIVDYRYQTLPGAIANAKAAGQAGAQYAWESGYTGKEDTPEGLSYREERHINGDVTLAQWQYFLATGDLNWLKTRGYPVIKATADYWTTRAKLNPAKKRYEILQVVPPDENAELVNNSAYTNYIAQLNLRIAEQAAKLTGNTANPKWAKVADGMYIPLDMSKKRFIAFDGHKSRWVAKQADSELLIYPLQYKNTSQSITDIYKNTFDYYSKRVHRNGPAMTNSAYAVIASRLGDRSRTYKEFTKSYRPYFRGPFNYFNEKRSTMYENMCFLTGAAGPIQSTIFGLAGASMDYFPSDLNSIDLQFHPCLPKEWKSLKLTGVQWRGREFDVAITTGDRVRITAHHE